MGSEQRQVRWAKQGSSTVASSMDAHPSNIAHAVHIHSDDLRFVPESGVARPNGDNRQVIRSHAKRRRISQTEQGPFKGKLSEIRPKSEDSSDVQTETSSTMTRSLSSYLSSRAANSSVGRSLDPDNVDPFGTLPVEDVGKTSVLMRHFSSLFVQTRALYSPKDEVIGYVTSDPAFFHAALAHTALHLCNLSPERPYLDLFYHHGQSIRLLNNRIKSSNIAATLHTTVGAITCLTNLEIERERFDGAKIHLSGIEALLRSRGGIESLATHPLLRAFVIWTDTIASIVTHTEPRLELDSEYESEILPPYSPLARRYEAKLFNLTGLPDLSEETINIFWELRHLTPIKDGPSDSGLEPDGASFLAAVERLERRITKLLRLECLDVPNEDSLIYKLFGSAALIHIILILRKNPYPLSTLPFCNLFSIQIRTLLEATNLQALQIKYPEMILWILMLGGMGGVRTPNQAWCANLLVLTCLVSGVRTRTEISLSLAEFLWTDLYLGPFSMGFWNKFEAAQIARDRDQNPGHGRDLVVQVQESP